MCVRERRELGRSSVCYFTLQMLNLCKARRWEGNGILPGGCQEPEHLSHKCCLPFHARTWARYFSIRRNVPRGLLTAKPNTWTKQCVSFKLRLEMKYTICCTHVIKTAPWRRTSMQTDWRTVILGRTMSANNVKLSNYDSVDKFVLINHQNSQ